MSPRTFARIRFFRLILVTLALTVVARLVDVQVVHAAQYRAAASRELTVKVTVPALRGGLYDRQGHVLAISVPTKEIVADDFQITHPLREASVLSPLLGIPESSLSVDLAQRSGYVVLASHVAQAQAAKISAARLPGITELDSMLRVAPAGPLAAPVLGYLHASGVGAAGLELEFNRLLAGTSRTETLLESPLGIVIPDGRGATEASGEGTGLELTLDEPLQYEAEQALAAEIETSGAQSGEAIVMDVHSGQILAMANLVRTPSGGNVPNTGGRVAEAPQNLALTQAYEPGSVFKLVTFAAALQEGVITPSTVLTVPDTITLDGSLFHDAESHPTEQLTATQVLAQSSNIGTSEVASRVGERRLLAEVKTFGFGAPTGLNFPGETPGLLAGASQWEPTNIVSLPIGQVDAVTAQQVLDAFNAVANGGVFIQPSLVRATVDANGRATAVPPPPSHRVLSPTVAAELTTMFEQVVTSGTGTSAVIPGYTVAGKTGTAQIPITGGDGYVPGAYMATFVGFAPAEHPVLSAIVVLDHPTPIYGGTVAAPVFAQIMGYALHRYGIPTSSEAASQAPNAVQPTSQAQDVT